MRSRVCQTHHGDGIRHPRIPSSGLCCKAVASHDSTCMLPLIFAKGRSRLALGRAVSLYILRKSWPNAAPNKGVGGGPNTTTMLKQYFCRAGLQTGARKIVNRLLPGALLNEFHESAANFSQKLAWVGQKLARVGHIWPTLGQGCPKWAQSLLEVGGRRVKVTQDMFRRAVTEKCSRIGRQNRQDMAVFGKKW